MDGEKLCLYCAEEIKAAAFVCRYCGRACLSGAVGIYFLGHQYVVALTDQSTIGIWDIAQGGPPFEVQPGTDAGLRKAAKRVDSLHRGNGSSIGFGVGVAVPLDF